MIMPLANRRDKETQVIWGIGDFESRFGRKPEGMWLPETAVDLETLEFTGAERDRVYDPGAAAGAAGATHRDAELAGCFGRAHRSDDGLPATPLEPDTISLFFYDGPISRGVAFEGLLDNGEAFADRLMGAFSDSARGRRLAHIATDGETYGHHHRLGEMALSYAIEYLRSKQLAEITNYGQFLERHPPTHEVEIFENSSWSCIHGIERWRSDCGCNSGHPAWNQAWRAPLRAALDLLRDELAPRFEEKAREYLKDPWAARNDYISVVLDRSSEKVIAFLSQHGTRELSQEETVTALKLLELERHLMLMYTSCGWFFDEISGLESTQVMKYAAHAIQISQELFGNGLEQRFLEVLSQARSNIPEHENGACIYQKFTKPAVVDLKKVAAHYAINSIFEAYPERTQIYCFSAERVDHRRLEAGRMRLAVGRARFTSVITRESELLSFVALHFGDHNLSCGVRAFSGNEAYEAMAHDVGEAFSRADIPEVLKIMERELGPTSYSLKTMFRDDQRTVLRQILDVSIEEAESEYRQIFEHHAPLLHFLRDVGTPLPKAIATAVEFALNSRLRQEFSQDTIDRERVRNLIEEARGADLSLDTTTLEYTLRLTLERVMTQIEEHPEDLEALSKAEGVVSLARSLPFEVVLWTAQNIWTGMRHGAFEAIAKRAESGDRAAFEWVDRFLAMGEQLTLRTN